MYCTNENKCITQLILIYVIYIPKNHISCFEKCNNINKPNVSKK